MYFNNEFMVSYNQTLNLKYTMTIKHISLTEYFDLWYKKAYKKIKRIKS